MSFPNPQHFLEGKRIAIAGAGVSGLAFALSLHKLWPSISSTPVPEITLYERDACVVPPNREGYSLSIRSDRPSAGIQTLQKMGILDRLLSVAVTGFGARGEGNVSEGGFVVWDKQFNQVLKMRRRTPPGCPVSGMRITRSALRRELVSAVEALPRVDIQWDNAVLRVGPKNDGREVIEIRTSKGESQTANIFIAADGSSSKLRALLRPDDTLKFAGPTCILGRTTLAHMPSGRNDEFGTAISGTGPALFFAPLDANSLIWTLSWIVPPGTTPPQSQSQPLSREASETLLAQAREIGGPAFGARFLDMLRATDLDSLCSFNAQDKQPFSHSGAYIQAPALQSLANKVVFLGDANHALSPFAGNGANLALMDGWDFAHCLVSSANMEEALRRYDTLAVGRARQVIKLSHFNILVMHSTGWMMRVWMCVLKVMKWLFFE